MDEDEVVMVEEMEEEEGRDLDADLNYDSQRRESTDDEDDEEAKAWLQAHPSGALPLPPLPRYRYSEGELTSPKVIPLTCHVWQQPSYQDNNETQVSDMIVVSLEEKAQWASGDDQRTESWHCLPQEMDSSHTLDTTQTRFNVREKGTEVTNFPSLEEGILTKSENQVKEPSRDLLCSPLLVIQDSFASPDLPLLTCLTKDQEFGPDSLFHQSELDFARLRGIPEGLQGKAESDICTLDDAAECCSLDENAVVCSKRVAELQREICGQGDLTSECTELAGLKNLLDDLEICDSSPHWQSSVELPSKEESSCEVPVGPSDTDINQSFSSALPPFVPHESTRELEYHSADLRMLRVSPDTVPGTLKHLTENRILALSSSRNGLFPHLGYYPDQV